MATTAEVKNKLAERANKAVKPAEQPQTLGEWLQHPKFRAEIARALPRHMDPDRMLRIAMTVVRQTPDLQKCTVPSVLGALMQAAQLGLEPGILGHCYLVPFRNGRTGQHEVQFIIGYKGLIDLARRSGNIQSIAAHPVYENDLFEFEYGLNERLRHVPYYAREDRRELEERGITTPGEMVGVYAYAKFKDGGHQIGFMTREQVDAIRKRSRAGQNGPWVTDYEEMARKTIIRNMAKYLPISVEIMRGIEQDETIKRSPDDVDSEAPDYGDDVIDAEFAMRDDEPAFDGQPDLEDETREQQGLGV